MFKFLRQTLLTILFAAFASHASAMFIQPDWLDPTMQGVGTNRYSYSANDPVNRLDPGGNQSLADPIPGPVWQDNVVVGGVVIGGSIAYGVIMAGRPGGLIDMPPIHESPPPEFFENEGFTPSGYSGPGVLSTPSGEFIDIGIVSTPESGAGGVIVSTPDGQTFELPNYVESRGNILGPDPNATGPHTTPKYGPDGKITGYQEWTPNPKKIQQGLMLADVSTSVENLIPIKMVPELQPPMFTSQARMTYAPPNLMRYQSSEHQNGYH